MKVFISYRRDDSAGHTGRLYDSLRSRFGPGEIFQDHSGIDAGRNFVDVIQEAIRSCDVLLAVIGRDWLTATANGTRRLDEPTDLVRAEIATALELGIPVIPVLVDRAAPVSAGSLPEPLRPLATIDAHELTDERWSYDVDRLIAAIETLAGAPAPKPQRRWWIAAVAVGAVAIPVLAFVLWIASDPASPGRGDTPARAEAPVQVAGDWSADVAYEWGARHTERFAFTVDGQEVLGTASFLGIPRGIVDGTVEGDRVRFATRTQEVAGDWNKPTTVVHRYRGQVSGDTIRFTMESEGGSSQVPAVFTAVREPAPRR